MTKKVAIALTMGVLFLLLSTGVALALVKLCDQTICVGTSQRDLLTGTDIDNTISGKAKADTIDDTAGPDRDTIRGGKGTDRINVREGNNSSNNTDFVNCGPDRDTVFKDDKDVAVGCERVNPDEN